MNDLHKSYSALGLEPGAPFDKIKRRYRRLALVWHPDRMTNPEAKREAEEELKKINNNFKKLRKHFESEHKQGPSCRCQPAAAGPPPNNSHNPGGSARTNTNSGASESERKRQEDEAARKRTAEREKREADAEAARRTAEAAETAKAKQKATEDAINGEAARKEEALRWKCAQCIGIAFIGLVAYCWLGCAARDVTHSIGRQWEDFQTWLSPKQQSPPAELPSQSPEPPIQPYIPPYERPPTGNPTSWRQYIEDATAQRNEKGRTELRDAQDKLEKLEPSSPFGPPMEPPASS